MKEKFIQIAVGKDDLLWHEKFSSALALKAEQGYPLQYKIVDLDRHDWIQAVIPFDIVIWKPAFMGEGSASHFKEKIYFLEKHLGKQVVPNFRTIWHFESKIAQSYLFSHMGLPVPQTVVSFEYHNADEQLQQATFPIVYKKSHGAGSNNVHLIPNLKTMNRILQKVFCQQLWDEQKKRKKGKFRSLALSINRPWFLAKIWQKMVQSERFGAILWQDFIPENSADLRITAIGACYAYGFWRNNRPNDFRASGSGRIDYDRAIPEALIHYCLELNRKLDFDSMAYDILFTRDGFVITEMSYAYLDSAIYNTRGYYELDDHENLVFKERHTWPQELWVEWALSRTEKKNDYGN